ncbi:MAG: T9SS type A sorting domain-containing protein [Bacteroidetes bacterium]|nr:T9SS type A sorting domain-containing protein [Bacteroidota bacterium]
MKFIHTAFFLLLAAPLLFSQTLEVAPTSGNPVLKSFAAQEALKQAAVVERMTGHNPLDQTGNRVVDECPPDFIGYLVEAGQLIDIELDTFGLGKDTTTPVITILNGGGLQFGSANLPDSTILLTYSATSGFNGAGIDTVLLNFSQPGHDTVFQVVVHVKRVGRVVVSNPQTVGPESITNYCLDNELDFAKPKACSLFSTCADDYDGEGAQLFHFSSYAYPDTCVVYYASRFPGVDTVCVQICDEWGVCDVFKIPFIVTGDTISIAAKPFFDDFSSYDGPYPSADFWLDKNVYRNATLAKDPPSVGFVTFDGLDRRGDVYDIITGVGDRLTSKAIDLSGLTANSDVVLRFFLAPKGYGLEPEVTDDMVLEFRNAQGDWVLMGTYDGMDDVPIDSFPPFLFYAIEVEDPQFLHAAFQFRFSANTSPGGSVDLWHLDYVYLDKQSTTTDFFRDVAFTRPPTSIFKNYTALPLRHLKGFTDEEIISPDVPLKVGIFNHFNDPKSFSDSRVSFLETTQNQLFNDNFTLADASSSLTQEKQHRTIERNVPGASLDGIKSQIENIPNGSFRNLRSVFAFEPNDVQDNEFLSNDTVRIDVPLSNYFAHDDGTAEWQVFVKHANGQGQQFATQFHANVADTLRAVQIMFPHVIGDVQDQLFNLKIWTGSLDNDPVLVRQLLKPFYPNNVFDTLQGFTTYVLDDYEGIETPVGIPVGDFFVGIEQVTAATNGIPVGFDLQNPCDCNWSNISGTGWEQFPSSVAGALMIRPVFGQTQNTSSGTSDVSDGGSHVTIFPNPTSGLVYFSLKNGNYQDYKVLVFNNLGQLVQQGAMEQHLDLSVLTGGVYFFQLLNEKTGELFSERIILTKP